MKNLFGYVLSIFLFLPIFAFAQTATPGKIFPNPFGNGITNLSDLLLKITNDIILPIGAVVVVVMVIYAGFLFVTAQGNETKITNAKRAVTYAVIGAVILLGSWVIANVIKETVCALYESGSAPEGLGCN
jgi:hypothetical protein